MSTKNPDTRAIEDQTAHLELALMEQFIRARGYDPVKLGEVSADDRERLTLEEASAHAVGKLAEVESRARFIHELHGER